MAGLAKSERVLYSRSLQKQLTNAKTPKRKLVGNRDKHLGRTIKLVQGSKNY
jgi:hypothetical protein